MHRHPYDVDCTPIDEHVCLRPTVHGGADHIKGADGSIAGGPVEHLAGFLIAHDRAPDDPGPHASDRCEGAVNVDPHLGEPRWGISGSLEDGDLTLTPSILCSDGFHGYVRNGKWVTA